MAVTSGLLLKDQGTVILGEWGLRTHNPAVCGLAFMVLYTFLELVKHFQIRRFYMRSLTSGSSWKFAILPEFPQLAEDNHHGRDTASLPLAR